ncbi:MAG: preprotein translocase subunit SecY [Mycoplasma sp.]
MIKKPEPFNSRARFSNINAAKKANKVWYAQTKLYFKKLYKQQVSAKDLSYELQAHIYDKYQTNLEQARKDYLQNKKNIHLNFKKVKVKKVNIEQQAQFVANNNSMWKKLVTLLTNKQVLGGVIFTALLLVFFHIVSILTIPGITIPDKYKESSTDFSSMLNLLAGGGLTRMSVFAVGVGPYITAQIIVQLLSSDLIPALSRLNKQGERGKRKMEVITRILTLPFCLIQAYAVIALILNFNQNASGDTDKFKIFGQTELSALTSGQIIALLMILTGGSYLTIFLGDMITKRGVGNGVTVIILAGILSNLPGNFSSVFFSIQSKLSPTITGFLLSVILLFIIYLIFYFLILLLVTYVNNCIRKIPVQQTGQGLTNEVKHLPYLPIKLNSAGVIPVIFASSIITIPATIAQFLQEGNAKWFINAYFTLTSWSGIVIYYILIVLFTFFYSYVQINPQQISENFEKSGRFIPGVQTGMDTEKHITKVLARVNWIGSFFLATIASLPYILSMVTSIPSGIAVGGTGIIIIVSATIEIWNSIKSAATTTGYEITRNKIQANYIDEDPQKNQKVEELW